MVSRVSLRGKQWIGQVETTEIGPLVGAFRNLTNAVVSEDGMEIRPAPGLRLGAKPFHGQAFTVSNVSVGVSTTTITLTASQEGESNAYLPTTFYCYIPADSADATTLGIWTGTRTGLATFTIPTITSGVSVSDIILIRRVYKTHALAAADGCLAAVVETELTPDHSTSVYNLATTVGSGALSLDTPLAPGVPDGDDEGCVLWPSPTMWAMVTGEYNYTRGPAGALKLRNIEILRRMHTAALNGRVLIAVPGHGCMFQANVRNHRDTLDVRPPLNVSWPDSRWTKMLGIPRGILNKSAITASNTGGSVTDARWYTFAVGYRDPYTGEVGLASPPQAIYVAALSTNLTLNIACAYPRGISMDTAGLQLVLYASEPLDSTNDAAGQLSALAQPLFPYAVFGPFITTSDVGLLTYSAPTYTATNYSFVVTEDPAYSSRIEPDRLPVIELPPPGASWVNVAKSRMLCGGDLPSYWDMAAWPVAITKLGETGNLALDYFVTVPSEWNVSQGIPATSPVPLGKIPTSYNGRLIAEVGSYDASGTLTMGTGNTSNLGRIVGQTNGVHASVGPHSYQVAFRAGDTTTYNLDALRQYRIFAPNDLVAVSEEAEPGVCPSTNYLPVDGLDVIGRTTGAARLNEMLLLFTQKQTYLFGWASLPQYPSAIVLSNNLGCASPHSIVEGPGFVAWLSKRGPCVSYGGAPQWIGKQIGSFWDTVLRDSEGMIPCAGAAVDTRRSLVVWAVKVTEDSDWTAATTDQLKSTVACDRLIVWNYATMGFSIIERDGQRKVQAIATLPVDDGVDRVAMQCSGSAFQIDLFSPIYAWDGVAERASTATSYTLTARRDPSTSTAAITGASTTIATSDFVFIRSADGKTVRYVGAASAAAGASSVALSSADGAVWNAGDVLVANGPKMTLQTHRMSLWAPGVKGAITGISFHCDIDASNAYARIVALDESGGSSYIGPRWGHRLENGTTVIRSSALSTDLALRVDVFGDGDIRIRDIAVEVDGGASS